MRGIEKKQTETAPSWRTYVRHLRFVCIVIMGDEDDLTSLGCWTGGIERNHRTFLSRGNNMTRAVL